LYKHSKKGGIALDEKATADPEDFAGHVIRKGIVYETPLCKQDIIEKTTGVRGYRSGDGTVGYASLNYCAFWKNSSTKVTIDELEGVEHREMLANRLFFLKLLEYVAEKREDEMSTSHDLFSATDDLFTLRPGEKDTDNEYGDAGGDFAAWETKNKDKKGDGDELGESAEEIVVDLTDP